MNEFSFLKQAIMEYSTIGNAFPNTLNHMKHWRKKVFRKILV